ncbi:hypothetical protein BK662_15705 [Pseudomonas frederiksbergensis]|uniref:Uncharacterized protein n=1 Tax=Pseudomonas frederiksbergensis TaxID=104087 RepID=A0A423HP09_9PSED|nr:hypothetical protein BK662_15705 [Pseudomonas frederiksbergensis]
MDDMGFIGRKPAHLMVELKVDPQQSRGVPIAFMHPHHFQFERHVQAIFKGAFASRSRLKRAIEFTMADVGIP